MERKPKNGFMTIRLADNLKTVVMNKADKEMISASEYIRRLILRDLIEV